MIVSISTAKETYALGDWNIDKIVDDGYFYEIHMSYGEHEGIITVDKEKVIEVKTDGIIKD